MLYQTELRSRSKCFLIYGIGQSLQGFFSEFSALGLIPRSWLIMVLRSTNTRMKFRLFLLLSFLVAWMPVQGQNPGALRVFIRAGEKTHGPGQHDGPVFLRDWTKLLTARGAKVDGKIGFPSGEQLENTDVMVLYAAEAGTVAAADRVNLEKFLKRGGGLVVIHDSVCGTDPQWWKTVIGGAWEHGFSKWFEGDVSMYFTDYKHELTEGVSNWDFDDEIYWDLRMMPEAKVLAASYAPDKRASKGGRIMPSVYDIVPQMWVYEKDNYRAFVSIPGHNTKSFGLPHFRGMLLRGIAWAGKREMNSLCSKVELESFRYPEGGPSHPEKTLSQIRTWPEFTTSLAAAEPMVQKPMSVDWDPAGRMWVAEAVEYPAKTDKTRPARDRISILEDTNGDGVMDKKTIFYEGLELVTSFVFYKDGVIVSQAPDVLFVRDTNGDGKGDKVEKVYTGFGTFDTHAVISNLRWGMDGWIYATVGYSRGDIKSGDGTKYFGKINDGVFRFKADGTAIEQFSSKGSNTWGVDVAPDGEVFYSQANGNHIDHVVMPEGVLARGKVGNATSYKNIEDHNKAFPARDYHQQAYVQIDWVGNWTAAAGACVYNGGAWPAKWDYTFTVTEPTLNLVHLDLLKANGPTFTASRPSEYPESEIVASTDLWFRPIHTRIGPDGALYTLDFYNQAAVHNDTRGPKHGPNNAAVRPDRDHYFGRVWRTQHKDAKKWVVPNLSKASSAELVQALNHLNGTVRMNAQRLLVERGGGDSVAALNAVAMNADAAVLTRVNAAWTGLGITQTQSSEVLTALWKSGNAVLQRTAMQMVRNTPLPADLSQNFGAWTPLLIGMAEGVRANDDRTRLEVLMAFAVNETPWYKTDESADVRKYLIESFDFLKDHWSQSAMVAYYKNAPVQFLKTALENGSEYLRIPVTELSRVIASSDDSSQVAAVVLALARQSGDGGLKALALGSLSQNLKPSIVPTWSGELQEALASLLGEKDPAVPAAVLPLISRWDKEGKMASQTGALVAQMINQVNDASQTDDQRAQLATSLLAVRQVDAKILPAVAKIAGSNASAELQRRVIDALGNSGDPAAGAAITESFSKLPSAAQEAAFTQIIKRAEWASVFVEALASKKIALALLNPVSVGRLRTHANKGVSDRAIAVINDLRGPEMKEKNALIALLTPEVEKVGNSAKGKELFTQNCAACHKFNGAGRDLAPDLTGMGVHGVGELLVHIIDPNRVVEPNYLSWSFDTLDGETYDGIVGRENRESVLIRTAVNDLELKTAKIKSRRNTGRSLMPDGFEALEAAGLRDLLTYLTEGDLRFRALDFGNAFTANSTRGIYVSTESAGESIHFKRFGLIKAGGVPFEVANPARTANGNNVVVLKGGEGFARTLPQKVEINGHGVKAKRLHFLGGIGGWAFPCCGNDRHENLPVAKVTVNYTEGEPEIITLTNGVEVADYIGEFDVPGSKKVDDIVRSGQVRWFTKSLKRGGAIKTITLESFSNFVAPTFVAITADTGDGPVEAATTAPAALSVTARTLIVGGNSSHDFNKWFNEVDTATLKAAGIPANYTEATDQVGGVLKDLDVLYLSNNKPFPNAATRDGISAFALSGKGLMLVHAALWYSWNDWSAYNSGMVGGGARSHDKYGEFEVTVDQPDHPIMAGVPKTFRLSDELYHFEGGVKNAKITVLATGRNAAGKSWPVVWVTSHPTAKIACMSLGHDGASHNLKAYQTILKNMHGFVSGKTK